MRTIKTKMEIIKAFTNCLSGQYTTAGDCERVIEDLEALLNFQEKQLENQYNKGLSDAWELTRKITGAKYNGKLTEEELSKIFGTPFTEVIFKHNTYQEALAKIEAYNKAQNTFKAGDFIRHRIDRDIYGVVTKIQAPYIYILFQDGSAGKHPIEEFEKISNEDANAFINKIFNS